MSLLSPCPLGLLVLRRASLRVWGALEQPCGEFQWQGLEPSTDSQHRLADPESGPGWKRFSSPPQDDVFTGISQAPGPAQSS